MLDDVLMTLYTKHHIIKAERAQMVQSDIVRYYPRSKLPFRGIHDCSTEDNIWFKHLKKHLQKHINAQNTYTNVCRDEDLR